MNQFLLESSWWVPCYGLAGAVLTLPWAVGLIRRTGPRPAAYLNLIATIIALIHSSLLLKAIWNQPAQTLILTWLKVPDLDLSLALNISPVTAGAAVLVGAVSLFAQVYALGSMEMDWAMPRFYALMGFFEAAMSGIALSDSLFLSYMLLELLTLSTYLLVGFWYAQPEVGKAARDAFWTKRVGDLFLLMGVVALSTLTDSLNFSDLTEWAHNPTTIAFAAAHPGMMTLLGLALIAGPTGKCAQVPLHLWLDEAMEGPNPASVLRNSVVVACGAYVLIRLQPILDLSPIVLATLIAIGSITAVGASLVAIAQIDLKRALSHSTSAYLGLVFIAVGTQQTDVALWFLFTHAIARALLFMSVGSVMMTTSTQHLEEMGGLWSRMPATTVGYVIGSFSLIGLLPLGNFWSMLELADRFWYSFPPLFLVVLLVNGITAFGLLRVFGLVFYGAPRPKTRRAPEVAWSVALPLVALIVVALLVPLMLFNWHLLPEWEEINWTVAALLIASGGAGVAIGSSMYLRTNYELGSAVSLPPKLLGLAWKYVQNLLANDLYVVNFYSLTVIFLVEKGSRLIGWIDRYIVDGTVNFLGFASVFSGEGLKYTITGRSQQYLLTIVVGTILVVALAFLSFQ